MIIDTYFNRSVDAELLRLQAIKKNLHLSSGKLSASILGEPLQWQMLKVLGVPDKIYDAYTLRKFGRGDDVEAWFLGKLLTRGLITSQTTVEYLDCIGIIDAVVDTEQWDAKLGIIPHEVKSVTRAKFRNIRDRVGADPQHQLQATFYALALGSDHYAIDYIVADDYDVRTMIYRTENTADEVHTIIEEFKKAMNAQQVPVYAPRYSWQDGKYGKYLEWKELDEKEIMEKLKQEYPAAYKKFF